MKRARLGQLFCCSCLGMLAVPAAGQETNGRTVRVGLGVQANPKYPGADEMRLSPLFEFSMRRGDEPFEFEAADESFGFALLSTGGFEFGPSANYQGRRRAEDVGAPVDEVGATVELGAFVQYRVAPSVRLRGEVRKGIGGHEGWTGVVGADYIIRDGDRYVFSIGPRVTLSDARYHRAYFGVSPAAAAASGLPEYRPGGGAQAVGLTAGLIHQINARWGIYGFARYDRLIGDAARSPLVRNFGSRDQVGGGLALTYTFRTGR